MASGELWRCPTCGRQFANTNQWHSCLDMELEDHLADHSAASVDLYRAVQAAVERCGGFRIHPQKTRIAFIATMSFAGVSLAKSWIDVSFVGPRAINDARIRKLELYGPTSFAHTLRIGSVDEVDRDVEGWLCEAWRRGTQETLDPAAPVDKVTGHARSVMIIPLASRVVASGEDLGLALPAYAVGAIGIGEIATARIPGNDPESAVVTDEGLRFESDLLRSLGLGVGDDCDVFLEPT